MKYIRSSAEPEKLYEFSETVLNEYRGFRKKNSELQTILMQVIRCTPSQQMNFQSRSNRVQVIDNEIKILEPDKV